MQTTSTEYMSGFFDGEGFIRIAKQSSKKTLKSMGKKTPSYHVCVGVTNINPFIVEQFKDKFGGYIYANKKDNRKICFQWVVYDIRAVKLIKQFLPYLIIKKDKALVALDFNEYYQSTKSTGKEKPVEVINKLDGYFLKLKELNAKGAQWLISHQQRLSEELQDCKYKIYNMDEAIVRTTRERVEVNRNV